MLENLGLEIWETKDGDAVLSLASVHPPDLLIVDVGIARIDGIAVIAQLRELELLNRAKVVALAGGQRELEHARLVENRIDRVLIKPLRAAPLRMAITELLPNLIAH